MPSLNRDQLVESLTLYGRLGLLQLSQQFPHDVTVSDDFLGIFTVRDASRKLHPRVRALLRNCQRVRLRGGQAGAKLIEEIEDDAFLHEDLGVGHFAVVRGTEPQQTVQPVLLAALLGFVTDAQIMQPQRQLQHRDSDSTVGGAEHVSLITPKNGTSASGQIVAIHDSISTLTHAATSCHTNVTTVLISKLVKISLRKSRTIRHSRHSMSRLYIVGK